MRDWPRIAIGEVAQVFDGPHATPKTVSTGPIFLGIDSLEAGRINLANTRHVTPADFETWTRRVKPSAGDVVFSYETKLGEAAIIPEGLECCLGRRMGLVRTNPARLDSRFFLYAYLSPEFQELIRSRTVTGATVDRIALTEFPHFRIPLPPLAEQHAIAHALGTLDDKIELNKRASQTMEVLAQAVFKDWFVAFGPIYAKAANGEPYLPSDVWQAFPSQFDGGTPQGWTKGPISEWVAFNPREPLRKGALAPYLDMAALPTAGPTADAPVPREFGSGMKFRNGDTLMARITPCLENGKTAFVQSLPDRAVAWGSTEFIVMRPIAPVPGPYGYLLARDAAFREHAIRSMTGTSGRQRAQVQAIASFPVCLPPDESVWKAFAAVVDPLFAGIRANAEESRTLAGLRDVLLPKLMSGDIRIKDAERFIEEATT
jgi:type I restriction enzyme, S subunit